MSWTRSLHIAEKFALYGAANPAAVRRRYRAGGEGIVYKIEADREIICAPCLLGAMEGEYILDPRGIKPTILIRFPAER